MSVHANHALPYGSEMDADTVRDMVRTRNKLGKKLNKHKGALASDASLALQDQLDLLNVKIRAAELARAPAQPKVYEGFVRMYDTARNYGFLICPELQRDVFVHQSELGCDAAHLVPGQAVCFSTDVRRKDRPAVAKAVALSDPSSATYIGTLKFFDWKRGFGFACTDDLGDVFLPKANLLEMAEGDMLPGKVLTFQLEKHSRGEKAKACVIQAAAGDAAVACACSVLGI